MYKRTVPYVCANTHMHSCPTLTTISYTCIYTQMNSHTIGSFNLASGAWTQFADSAFFCFFFFLLLAKHIHHFIAPSPLIELLSVLLQLPPLFFTAQIQSRPLLKGLILIWLEMNRTAVCLGQTEYDTIYMCEWRQLVLVIDDNVTAWSCGGNVHCSQKENTGDLFHNTAENSYIPFFFC